jgi:hypothetical protein
MFKKYIKIAIALLAIVKQKIEKKLSRDKPLLDAGNRNSNRGKFCSLARDGILFRGWEKNSHEFRINLTFMKTFF